MNKTAIKNFAISARKKLMAMAKDQAGMMGITADHIADAAQTGSGFAVYPTYFGTQTTLTGDSVGRRASLVRRIEETGYEAVMEEVAYTWFNRLIAVRFMEVNDYLPTRIRVLSSETPGKLEPDLVTGSPKVDLGFSAAEAEEIYALKDDPRKSGELFKKLFIKQCNALGEILPQLFEKTADYTELLLDLSWDKEDGVVRELLTVDEADFREAVEIIGWMYQYYNTEPKQDVFDGLKKNVKITKENIPAATQLFTPDWIVRYMVENSLGRLWLEQLETQKVFDFGHIDFSNFSFGEDKKGSIAKKQETLKSNWKYYLDEAEQEEDVKKQLYELRMSNKNYDLTTYKLIDPCMGSGHILVYAFDIFMQIYLSEGWSEREAVQSIFENNLYGLDIDKRAYQLSYFAVMMKGRQYDRRFLTRGILPQLYCPAGYSDGEEFGSLLRVDELEPRPEEPRELTMFNLDYARELNTWNFRRLLAQKYDVVVTNPPYMGISNGNGKLNDYVKKNYPDSKADMFAVFIEQCGRMTERNSYTAMITQHSWMFLSSFEKLREKMLHTNTVNMAHLGARAFEEIGGEVVQTTSWVQRKAYIKDYQGTYARLVDYNCQQEKENAFLACGDLHTAQQENFSKIPGSPIAYWVSERVYLCFTQGNPFSTIAAPKQGMSTANNDLFLRFWHEVDKSNIGFNCASSKEAIMSEKKWFPHTKGGEVRKWYGNNEYVVNWYNDGEEIKKYPGSAPRSTQYYFKEGLAWSTLTANFVSFRYQPTGYTMNTKGSICYLNDVNETQYILGFLNSKICMAFLVLLAPTLDYSQGPVGKLPIIIDQDLKCKIKKIVSANIFISQCDWDSFETSWDFKRYPLI